MPTEIQCNIFELRATLITRLILKGHHLPKEKYDSINALIKSHIDEDLYLASEILDALAI